MKAIVNTNIVLTESIIIDGVIIMENGLITNIGERGKINIPENAKIVDAEGNYSAPGLIDIHTHSGGGVWFYENAEKAAAYHLKHGITSVMPALYFNLTKEQYIAGIKLIKDASKKGAGKIIEGLYMEGPYLNPKFGCDTEGNIWADQIERESYQLLLNEAGEFAKVWCIAPEREGITKFVEDVRKVNIDAIFSVAHSEASPEQIYRFIPEGLRLATHHTNATGDLSKYPECRGVCVDEAVNYSDDIFAELICDSMGIHVDPFMLRLVVKIKGKDKIILISDACEFNGPVPPGYDGVTDINFDQNGEIAGSKLTLDAACRNMMKHTGAGLCDLFKYASYNPSVLLNRPDIGCVKIGNKANIIIIDNEVNVKKVFLEGETIN